MMSSQTILRGALLGITSAIVGWIKNSEPGNFQLSGLLIKLPAGVVVGIIAEAYGMSLNDATELFAGLGMIEGVDGLTKTVVRRFYPDFMKLTKKIDARLEEKS